jgi:DtxR family Mn-dependent transcriptional regulator
MNLDEKSEEALETLWIAANEQNEDAVSLERLGARPVNRLVKAGLVAVTDDKVSLTEAGIPEARSVVRRHRLAERLLTDILGAGESQMHDTACKFEHLLDRGLDDNICTLLGHPKVCPHGKQIPPGRCCLEESEEARPLISPLSHLAPGEGGEVAYVYAPEAGHLQKLLSMGILPGAPIKLVQKFPSFVFDAGHSQFAVDSNIADAIYVRLLEEEPAPASNRRKDNGRRRWSGRGGRHRRKGGRFGGLW